MNNLDQNGIRIIWNVTSACPFNCKICAASANSSSDSKVDKIKILDSILTIKDKIKDIDFAGGNPLFLKEDKEVVRKATQIIDAEKISISTTGYSLSKMTDEEICKLNNSYDLTYDFPNEYKDLDLRDEIYNLLNYEQAIRLKKIGVKVNIQIPIQPNNMKIEVIDKLVKDLVTLNPNRITLIRLMPVGYLDYSEYPIEYNPFLFIDYFLKKIKNENFLNQLKCNCALRCVDDTSNCGMISKKIGIDKFGNVYSCIWGADINIQIGKNPFFIGNLLDSNLKDLLDLEKTKKFQTKINSISGFCKVFSFISSNYDERGIITNNDILRKN